MFGRSMFREMEQDDFFSGHSEHMRQMEQMMADPFRGMGMIDNGRSHDDGRRRRTDNRQGQSNAMSPFGQFPSFGSMFGNMDRMMADMDRAFVQASQNGDGHSFQQTSVMSFSKSGDGAPKIYQASTATKRGPGGIRETRKALRDSERELEKMSVGRHIRDRGHEIEKHRNTRSGQMEEMQNYRNIDEKDAESFNREWQDQARTAFRGLDHYDRSNGRRGSDRRQVRDHGGRREQLALPPSRSDVKSEHWGRSNDDDIGRDRS
ncbi:Myeloid leukemia factor 1 [Mactra antiquata]